MLEDGDRLRSKVTEAVGVLRQSNAAFRAQLVAADKSAQREILGERLYPLVAQLEGAGLAGKITGMLLELEAAELVGMLEDSEHLRSKVTEAVGVLRQANQLPPGAK